MLNVRKSLIIFIIITAIYGLYYKGIPALLNLDKHCDFIEAKIKEETGFNVEFEKPYFKTGLRPSIWLMAENINIQDNDNNDLIKLKHSAIKIKLLPLLTKNIEIANFSSDYVGINLTYTSDGKLKFGQYELSKLPKSNMNLSKAFFRISDYDIKLQDFKQNKTIFLDGNYLVLDEFKKNKHLKLSTDAKLFVDQKSSQIMADIDVDLPINKITEDQFKINGHITDLDLADFSDYAAAFSDGKINRLSGKINMYAETLTEQKHKTITSKILVQNLGIMQKDITKSIFCNNELSVKSVLETINNGLSIRSAEIKADGINVSVNGNIRKLDAKFPTLDTNISIINSQADKFIPLLPPIEDIRDEVSLSTLKQNDPHGIINGFLNLKGKADEPEVNGKILAQEVWLNEQFPYNTPKATVKLDFSGKKMSMDIDVPAQLNQNVKVTGNAELYGDKNADLTITSSSDVDLKTAQKVLNPLHDILLFQIGPVPIMDIKGKGNIDLHIIGNKINPHAWGIFNFKDATASFNDIHGITLTNGNGSLTFNDENTHFITKNANINGKPVKIDGTCTVKGVMDFKVNTANQDVAELLNAVHTSPMLVDIQKLLNPISSASGITDFYLNLTGTVPDVNDIVFNKNLFAKGSATLKNVSANILGLPISNINGEVKFNNLETNLNLVSYLGKSNVKISGNLNENNANLKVSSNNFSLKDGLDSLKLSIPYKNEIGNITSNFIANYNGKIDNIEIPALSVKGRVNPINTKNFSFNGSDFELNRSHLKVTDMRGKIQQNPYYLSLNISDLFSPKQSINSNFNLKNFDLQGLNLILPKLTSQEILTDFNGIISLKGQIKNNGIYSDIDLNNIDFVYKPDNLRTKISNGKLIFRNSTATLQKINMELENMPVFADGKIFNINTKKPDIKIFLTAKPTQEFIEQVFNKNSLYPIKLKGNINVSSQLSGNIDALRNFTQLKLDEDASIYYMGATLGNLATSDQKSLVNIITDNTLTKNSVKINSFKYDKTIKTDESLFTRTQMTSSGQITQLKNNDFRFDNFKIKTNEPTDAKIFNIIFRKPLMKQGKFTSDITINGKASSPSIFGKLSIKEIDVPLFDALIKDIDVDFKKDKIYLHSNGTVLTNKLKISAIMKNSFNLPFIFDDIKINLENLDINKIVQAFRDYDVNSTQTKTIIYSQQQLPDASQIIINNGEITANGIKIKELEATDFSSHFTLNNKMLFDLDNFNFKMAQGKVSGLISYNLLNNLTKFSMHVENTNAQIVSETLFDIKGQIYGSVTGDINLTCNGKSNDKCTQTLNGDAKFSVQNGRMPKLGSLEYLLKAGNLIKGGLTGLSINGIIDLITPYKTGEFASINGYFAIQNGIAHDIKIYSAGKDLNMYMKGSYNLNNMIADMRIFGALTKNFSTLMGKIGNASLNGLFNTIPWVNISESPSIINDDIQNIPNSNGTNARMFRAEIYGDINGNDYVKEFKWLK